MQHKRTNKQADAPPAIRPTSLMFHWQRFVGMARTRCANEWCRWLLFLLGSALLYVLLLALCFFFSTRPVLDFRSQASFLYMTLPLAGPAFAWLYGAAWRKPQVLQRMRPVSALEHCLLGVLIVLVVYPLVHLLVLTLIHWPASKIDYLRSLAYWQGLDDDARQQLWEQLEKSHPWPHEFALYLPWRVIRYWHMPPQQQLMLPEYLSINSILWKASLGLWLHTVLSAIYLLGSLLFRRDAGVKTSVCVFALLLLTLFLSLTADTQMDHWLDLEDLFFSAPQARGVKKSALHWLANALFWLGVPLSLWLAVFQALLQRLSVPPLLAGTQRGGLWMASCALGLCWLWGGLLLTVVLAERHKPQTVFELSGSTIKGVDTILLHSEPEFYPREVIAHFDDVPHIRVSLEENVIFYRHPPRLQLERQGSALRLRAVHDAETSGQITNARIKTITLPLHIRRLHGESLRLYVRQGQRLPELYAYGNNVQWREGAADQLTLLAHAPCETPEITAHQAESRARDRARAKDRSGHPFPWMFDIWETDQPAASPPYLRGLRRKRLWQYGAECRTRETSPHIPIGWSFEPESCARWLRHSYLCGR